MSTFSVPAGCTGVELPNGKKIDANRQGKVTIDDARDEKAVKKSFLSKEGVVSRTAMGFGHIKRNTAVCVSPSCGFTGWGWQTVCPKCDSEMKKIEDSE